MGKDEFLKLLVAQLRNQDPLNPMDGQEFAAQLAQFSSVEQLMAMNVRLAQQEAFDEAMAQALNSSAAMGAIGHDVLAVGDQVQVSDTGGRVAVDIGADGGSARLRLYDESGKEVGSRDAGHLAGGRHTLELGSAGAGLEPGRYTYVVEVTDAAGNPVDVTTYTVGRVDGVRYSEEGPLLVSGLLEIPLGRVLEVSTEAQT